MHSGELFFRANSDSLRPIFAKDLVQVFTYLNYDTNLIEQTRQNETELKLIRKVRNLLTRATEHKFHRLNVVLPSMIECTCVCAISKIAACVERILSCVTKLKAQADANIMKCVLGYFEIIQREINANRSHIGGDLSETIRNKFLAKVLRDLKLFSRCVSKETKDIVQLQQLASDSPQALRCVKAVIDNVDKDFLISCGFMGCAEVNCVFKLEHKELAAELQVRTGITRACLSVVLY